VHTHVFETLFQTSPKLHFSIVSTVAEIFVDEEIAGFSKGIDPFVTVMFVDIKFVIGIEAIGTASMAKGYTHFFRDVSQLDGGLQLIQFNPVSNCKFEGH
jgi:hypothetical protein